MTDAHETNEHRVWEIVEKTLICMMTTRFTDGLRARPLEARPDREGGVIRFLTDVRGLKDDEIEANSQVCLTSVYSKERVYLSITGEASVSRNPEQAKKLWNQEQQAWWPGGPNDPNVLVIESTCNAPKCGMDRRVRRWLLSSSRKHGSRKLSPTLARSARSRLNCDYSLSGVSQLPLWICGSGSFSRSPLAKVPRE